MLKLKATFYSYSNEIDEHIKKRIVDKFARQLAKCIIADVTEWTGQAVTDKNKV